MNTRGILLHSLMSVTGFHLDGLSNVVGEIKLTIIILKDGVGSVNGLVVSNPLVSAKAS